MRLILPTKAEKIVIANSNPNKSLTLNKYFIEKVMIILTIYIYIILYHTLTERFNLLQILIRFMNILPREIVL